MLPMANPFSRSTRKLIRARRIAKAIGEITADARKKLGDKTKASDTDEHAQQFTAASLEAAQAYATGKTLERAGKLTEAATAYAEATVADPNLGRAFAGLALVEFTLGQTDEADRPIGQRRYGC